MRLRLALLFAAALLVAAVPTLAQQRNVLIIIADDHGQDTGAYGNPTVQTPNLDALAADGALFRHAFATTASCSASRSVVLSGLHNHRNGQYGHVHDYHHFQSFDNIRGLPNLLNDAGYRTAIVGKYHVAPRSSYEFQHFYDADQRNPVAMADAVRDFVFAEGDEPFFLYFAMSDPHRGGGTTVDSLYAPDRFGNRPGGRENIPTVTYDPAEVYVPPFLPDTPGARAEVAQYYESVSRIDYGVGYLLDMLREAGHFDNTLVIYMSDHGMAFPGAKTTVYEPGLRSPLIVRHPADGVPRGIEPEAMISWVDITPTVLDWANVEPPTYRSNVASPVINSVADLPDEHGLHGDSFLGIVEGTDDGVGRDAVMASHTFHEIQMYYPMRVYRDRDYKLIWNVASGLPFPFATDLWTSAAWQSVYQQGPDALYGEKRVGDYMYRPEFELYDMRTDPWEGRNLAFDPAYAEVLDGYRRKLIEAQERTSDPWVSKWTYE